jgi:dinuclear metal center YbgI/SA1388 family protein
MAKLNTIVRFLNKELRIKRIKDNSKNGLQVRGRSEVRRIAFGVDACMELFEKAKKEKCDLVIVHHGLLWKGKKADDALRKRINFLKKNRISLYAAHLPLDLHQKYGNNIELCRILRLKNIKKFGKYHGISIGYMGKTKKPISLTELSRKINIKLGTRCDYMKFGKNSISRIGIVSGGGADAIPEAAKKVDCLLTGEYKHSNYHTAKELGINVLAAGHYKTETLGVKALERLLKQKFNIGTIFIDIPTGM